ncbi:M48 family metallopeptidase [Thiothrix lacustris]|uniref:M48 family metallopeptidase n=1 Tax=Thiothrix lacustris TaxID=525917 RepID=UPI00048DACD3|nr:M48 family metallopeptidase [Thiothrix lacustris]
MKTSTEYRQQFEELVHRAEQDIAQHPTTYKRRLQGLALLGYSVIGGLLALLLLLTGGTVWLAFTSSAVLLLLLKNKLIIVLGGLLWVVGRSLLVRIPSPTGYALKPTEFPQLWSEVNALSKQLATPPIHTIILTPDMNAAIAQTPRLGIIGPHHNTLLVGLELLMALSPSQARAVLAHELAHLSGNHSKFAGWIYRVRQSWAQISHAIQQTNAWGTAPIRYFTEWYTPYFAGYSYVLARNNEYEADAVAGKLTSCHTTASALIATHVYAAFTQEQFWQPLYRKAHTQAQADQATYSQLQQFYQQPQPQHEAFKHHLRTVLTHKTNPSDTHPALIERLKALKATGLQEEADDRKALLWLGSEAKRVIQHFDQQWSHDNSVEWEEFYQRAQAAQQTIASLSQRDDHTLTAEERWQLASLTEQYQPDKDALSLYLQYSADQPDDNAADLAIGRLLLAQNDADGIRYLEKAMKNPALRVYAAHECSRYYTLHQQPQQANAWLVKLEAANDMMHEAQQERAQLDDVDILIAPEVVEKGGYDFERELLGTLNRHQHVSEVWVAQKQVRNFPHEPVFVLAVKIKGFILNEERLQQALLETLQKTSHNVFVVNSVTHKKLVKKVMAVGKQLY